MWSQLASRDQILCVASLGWGKGCIRFWGRLTLAHWIQESDRCFLFQTPCLLCQTTVVWNHFEMRLHILPRTTKKYIRILVIFFVVNAVLLSFSNLQDRSFSINVDLGVWKRIVQSRLRTVYDTVRENFKTPDIVIYSEDEVQIHLKGIHELGEETIGLKHDQCRQRLPKCLIVGNFKCGTQELLEFMYMHPRIRIYREPHFELHFFTGVHHGLDYEWYRKQMPCSYSGQITVEKSPDYFQDPRAPFRIREMNPSMKLIVMVRDPIERALSHFSFSDDIKRYRYNFSLCALNKKGVSRFCFAIKHSIYDEGIKRYLQVFNRNQIFVINNDDFRKDPFTVLRDIETFLGIEHVIDRKYFAYIEEKGFFCVRSVYNETLVACYDHRRGRKLKNQLPMNISISDLTMKKLKEYFKPRNEQFFEAIGQTFDWESNDL